MRTLVLVACLALPSLSFAQSAKTTTTTTAAAADASGTWAATFNTQNGQIPATIKLQKSGDKLGGTITSQQGEAPIEATLEGKALTVWFNYQSNGNAIPVVMNGTVDGDTAKGTMTAGGQVAGDWTATREGKKDTKEPAKDAKGSSDLSGEWTVSLVLDTINATPSLNLKQDGEKLSGDYISQQYGKFPLTGTVKGSDVSFSVSMNIEGNAINATYTGTVQADGSIKGSVGIGDAMSGTFTATKKK